jgi:hypothetical protein
MVMANPQESLHAVELHGAWGSNRRPSLVQRTDENFLEATLAELQGADPSRVVTDHRPDAAPTGELLLFQPVHRTFNLLLLEAHCADFMNPRLDPRKIESSGFVVRRARTGADGVKGYEAWCSTQGRVSGWVPLPPTDSDEHLRDPDPARRRPSRLTGDAEFDLRHRGPGDQNAEATTSLFVAPPGTASGTSRTLLYGVIPVTSDSRAGAMPQGAEPSAADWDAHVSLLLQASSSPRPLWPASSASDRAALLSRTDLETFPVQNPDLSTNPGASRFVLLVRQLAQEFSLLRPANSETRDRLVVSLNRVNIVLVNDTTRGAGDYLADAARLYFDQPVPSLALPRPNAWPVVSPSQSREWLDLLRSVAGEVRLAFVSGDQAGGRYDDPTARYVVRAFIRVRRPDGCLPRIIWSPYSEEFAIAPWHASGPAGPTPVVLPDPFDPDFLKRARPNVAFSVPSKLANLLNQDPKDFLTGKPGPGSGFALDWICGFNIPIITICAFIVLNIFLNLLNLLFFWLPFVKICIPFPRKK